MALIDTLAAYWPLDEAGPGGSRADAHSGGYALSETHSAGSGLGSAVGKLHSLAGDWVRTNSETLTTTATGVRNVIVSSASWTVAAWIYPANVAGTRTSPFGNFDGGFSGLLPNRRAPDALSDGTNNDQVFWQLWNDAGTPHTAEVTGTAGRTIAGQWSLIAARFNHVTGKWSSYTNGTASSDVTWSGTLSANAYFKLGQRGDGFTFWSGRIGPVMLFSSALSDADLGALYNSGNGLAYPFSSGQPAALRGVFVPGMSTGGRRVFRPGWGG